MDPPTPTRLPRPRTVVECFEGLPDPRPDRRRRHKLVDILVIGLCSILTVGEGFTDMECFGGAPEPWFRTFLELPHGIPSHDTFNRVFSAIDPHRFPECFTEWVQGVCPAIKEMEQYFESVPRPGQNNARPERTCKPGTLSSYQSVEKGHGRTDVRCYWQTPDIDWFAEKPLWKGLHSVGMVESERTVHQRRSVERRYYLSSLPLDAEAFARRPRAQGRGEQPPLVA